MRFDDRLKTALSHPEGGHAATQWRQLIDLLAQHPVDQDSQDIARGLMRLHQLHPMVPEAVRAQSVGALAGRLKSAPLVQFLCADKPAVVAQTMHAARLRDEEWAALVPKLPTRARGFLRQTDDIGPAAKRALAAWSHADFILTSEAAAPDIPVLPAKAPSVIETEVAAQAPKPVRHRSRPLMAEQTNGGIETAEETAKSEGSPSQITALVDRIRRFQNAREQKEAVPLPPEGGSAETDRPAERFAFETDARGYIQDAKGVPVGAVVGVSIAQEGDEDAPGTDAAAAAAFRARRPIAGARIRLVGAPAVAGNWRLHAGPMFDDRDGRFLGFSGSMRRPHAADEPSIAVQADDACGDEMRQLVHELRTPLNAIIGFAEIIDQQLFGPASTEYRALAESILDDARRLLCGFDDLDLAARFETGRLETDDGQTDPAWLLSRMGDRLQTLTDMRGVSLHLRKAETVRPFAVGQQSAERILTRLVSALIIGCAREERIDCTIRTRLGREPVNLIEISRPTRLIGRSEENLLSTEHVEDDAGEPLLGLGFSLRLVRNLARAVGGDLRFEQESLLLKLPAVKERLGREQVGRSD